MDIWLSSDWLPRLLRLILGGFLLWSAISGFRSGSASLVYRTISRREDPSLYWTAIAICALGGAFLALGAALPKLLDV